MILSITLCGSGSRVSDASIDCGWVVVPERDGVVMIDRESGRDSDRSAGICQTDADFIRSRRASIKYYPQRVHIQIYTHFLNGGVNGLSLGRSFTRSSNRGNATCDVNGAGIKFFALITPPSAFTSAFLSPLLLVLWVAELRTNKETRFLWRLIRISMARGNPRN